MGRQNTTFCPEVGKTEQRTPQREHCLKVVSRNSLLATNLYLASFPGLSWLQYAKADTTSDLKLEPVKAWERG